MKRTVIAIIMAFAIVVLITVAAVSINIFLLKRFTIDIANQINSALTFSLGFVIPTLLGGAPNEVFSKTVNKVNAKIGVGNEAIDEEIPSRIDLRFTAVILTTLLLCSFSLKTTIFTIEVLKSQNFLSFPKGDSGFVLLQQYISSATASQIFLLTCGTYGLMRGAKGRKTSYMALLFGCALGFIASTILSMILNWDITPLKTAALFLNPASEKITIKVLFYYVFTTLIAYFMWSTYTFLLTHVGKFIAKFANE